MKSKLPILNVASNQRNAELMTQFLGKEGYKTVCAATMHDFESSIKSVTRFGLAIVDITGFDRNIWNHCDRLPEINVPFVVVMPQQLQHMRHEGFLHGAQRVLVKPLVVKELIESVSRMCLEDQHG